LYNRVALEIPKRSRRRPQSKHFSLTIIIAI
jgi:hypothetical protein